MNALPSDFSAAAMLPGSPEPLGATWTGEGVNFAVHSSGATSVEVCIFDASGEHEMRRLALPERSDNQITSAINQWAADAYPTVQAHLTSAKSLKNTTDKRRMTN